MPHVGLMGSHDGMDNIVGVLGPLAHSARDLALFAKAMLEYKTWDLEAPLLCMQWNDDVAKGKGLPAKLCIAILADDCGATSPLTSRTICMIMIPFLLHATRLRNSFMINGIQGL